MKIACLKGTRLAYEETGRGADVLLLVHGHPFDHTMWTPQLDHFAAAGWRVLAPDLRGYGQSPGALAQTRLETFADDLVNLLNELSIDQVVAAGLSMGGQIVMELARAHRARLRGLVLAATFPQRETEEGKRGRYSTAERLEREGMEAYAAELLPRMLAPRTIEQHPQLARFVLEMMQRAPAAGAAAALRGRAERIDYRPTLAALTLPCLLVSGGADSFTTRAEVERMRELIGGSTLLWMDEVGHMPNLEAAPVFNTTLEEFLNRIVDAD